MQSTDRNELLDQLCDTVEELTRAVEHLRAHLAEIEAGGKKKPPAGPKPWRVDQDRLRCQDGWEANDGSLKDQKIPLGPVTLMPSPDDLANDPRKW
jgi:hypothetical protein